MSIVFYPFRLFLLLQLLAVLLPCPGYCQKKLGNPIIAYNHAITTEDGLSQNHVSQIIKDRDGFIWLGTGEGLDRFDGYSFIHYQHSADDTLSLSNNAIQKMLLDSKGRLWVGTYNGLNLYDSEKETFRKFLINRSDTNSVTTILYLLEDRRHQLWVGTYGKIYKIDIETFQLEKYDYQNDNSGTGPINALLEDRNGKIWAATNNGISIIGEKGIERTIRHSENLNGLPADIITSMVQDSTGTIYFGTNGSGVLQLKDENARAFQHFTTTPGKPFFGSDIIGSLCLDNNGKLLVGTDGSGIYKQDDTGTFRQILGSQSSQLHLGNIRNIFVDNDNVYWICLFGGVQVVLAGSRRFEHYRYFDQAMEEMGKNSVLAIAEDKDHKIWIGTDGAGLYQFDPQSKTFRSYQHSSADNGSLSSNVVKSLLVDEKNNVYAGTFGGGLNYLDTKTNHFTHYKNIPGNNTSISTNHVWSLLQDSNHRIYVGQLAGLDEFFPDRKTFAPLRITGPEFTPSIYSLQEDKTKNIWIGTRLDGIYRYDPQSKTVSSFSRITADATGIPTKEITELSVNADGNIWIGTADRGLVLLDPEKLSFKRIHVGSSEIAITNLLEDDAHQVWFTSFDGLHKLDPSTLKMDDYTTVDGLQGKQFNEGARLKSSDGTCYFGGTNGLTVFRPENITNRTHEGRIVFTQLSLFNLPTRVDDQSGVLAKSISQTESITLQAYQNVFSLEFACLDFNFPKKNKYQYRLEGFDKEWNDANSSRTATYTNLPHGHYTLKVRATDGSGRWNPNTASIKITITPRWYERSETKYGASLLLFIVIVFIIHLRTQLLYRQKIRLERLVKERTNVVETQKLEIKDKNNRLERAYEEVNSANEELQRVNLNLEKLVENRTTELTQTIKKLIETDKGLDTFLYRSSHDLRGPIATILGLAHLGQKHPSQDELHLYFANIEKTSTRMLRLLNRLSQTSSLFRAECTTELINMDDLIQRVSVSIQELNTNKTVRIEFENKITQAIMSDALLLECIITNLMENSIVFRTEKQPYAKCILRRDQGQLIINVIDNGTGMASSVIDQVSNMFFRGSEKSIGNGLGLFMVKKALEILQGTIDISSEPNVMTTITIRIPDKMEF